MLSHLQLGPLGSASAPVYRSGIFWLCQDGYQARPGEVIGFFNISADKRVAGPAVGNDAVGKGTTRQVAIAPPVGGRVRIPVNNAPDGLIGIWPVRPWNPEDAVAALEVPGGDEAEAMPARLMMLEGKRFAWPVDSDASLLPGGNWQTTAWWGHSDQMRSVLCLGLCDVAGIVRGKHAAFTELFEAAPIAAHISHFSEHPIIPCSLVIMEQLSRTPDQAKAISADIVNGLAAYGGNAADLSFASLLLRQLVVSPAEATHDCITATGTSQIGSAATILISLSSEPQSLLRHKKLGYHVYILSADARAAGPAMRQWLKASFEPVRRSVEDIRRHVLQTAESVKATTGGRLIVINRMSSSGRETIYSYSSFSAPLAASLSYVGAKEMNVMLDDLAAAGHLSIIDIDALGAEYGGEAHLPDGIHHSGTMQTALRAELLRLLAADPS